MSKWGKTKEPPVAEVANLAEEGDFFKASLSEPRRQFNDLSFWKLIESYAIRGIMRTNKSGATVRQYCGQAQPSKLMKQFSHLQTLGNFFCLTNVQLAPVLTTHRVPSSEGPCNLHLSSYSSAAYSNEMKLVASVGVRRPFQPARNAYAVTACGCVAPSSRLMKRRSKDIWEHFHHSKTLSIYLKL